MSIFWIIVISLILLFILILIGSYIIHRIGERKFKKNMKVGDFCSYYLNEYESLYCKVVNINGDIIEIEDILGEIYKTNIENISTP